MYFPKLVVLKNNVPPEQCVLLLNALRSLGLEPYVDAYHHDNFSWLDSNYRHVNHRFFNLGNFIGFTVNDLTPEHLEFSNQKPHLLVSYNTPDVTDADWLLIEDFVRNLANPKLTPEIKKFLAIPDHQVAQIHTDTDADLPTQYEFEMDYEEKQNIAFCQVTKPHTDRPYTVIVRDYSNRGLEPFFAGLFAVSSWGVSTADIAFLAHLWKHLNMKGHFDIDEILENATRACYPSEHSQGAPEPEVYRLSIPQTKLQLERKYGLFK